jgi:hypothetical protein
MSQAMTDKADMHKHADMSAVMREAVSELPRTRWRGSWPS